ncbi:hypothetical protein [Williamsia sterculiae]|uniref:Uncharacterized protein n=1 Tax=Williamsia sterculiae TaxID=1344003 RepID=A0A1N7H5X4_9NOCA|nr:hypothetical protein [Williamsia sterculiae]SIS20249.1 hypothetical protein SAMN05445060_3568 [Williamsia sterculiae]
MTRGQDGPSFARLALTSLGAGVLVLAISVPIVVGLSQVSPVAALVVALLAVVGAIAAIGLTSNHQINKALAEAEAADRPPNANDPTPRGTDEN